ncbi:hypothetical protein C1H46_040785 [Malus baccata]|uniref:NAD-dependent epimerase/dehydratase domain-containing protein n=1 Tax=Malus baccata TaxID=106549 RepID=A0A540KHI3_MALBA|nr:hypothetical protein C1H46_040785 [Malus baccata]
MMAAPAEEEKERVCVTGAGGLVGSWIVKLLLSSDYLVHGTVRNPPGDSKYAHLSKLEKASENLKLFKADLLDYNSLCSAVAGCSGVFHVANPVIPSASVTNPQARVELIEPAVKGTLNVLSACLEAKVKRAVVVSSISAVFVSPDWPKGQVKDDTCWSAPKYMKATKDLVDNYVRVAYPNYNYPHNLSHTDEEEKNVSSDKLQRLGWSYRPLEETLVDSIEGYRMASVLD